MSSICDVIGLDVFILNFFYRRGRHLSLLVNVFIVVIFVVGITIFVLVVVIIVVDVVVVVVVIVVVVVVVIVVVLPARRKACQRPVDCPRTGLC